MVLNFALGQAEIVRVNIATSIQEQFIMLNYGIMILGQMNVRKFVLGFTIN